MPKVKVKLKELRDADVRFISFVDRAASRIPFRVMKRGEDMGIDLTRIFKGDTKVLPTVAEVVVFAQSDTTLAEQVRQSIAKAGLSTDRVTKAEDGDTLTFKQSEQPKEGLVMVRLSDEMVLGVADMPPAKGFFADFVSENGFYPDLTTSMALVNDRVGALIVKNDDAGIQQIMTDMSEYTRTMNQLPGAVFTANEEVQKAIKTAKKSEEKKDPPVKTELVEDQTKNPETKVVEGLQPGDSGNTTEVKTDTPPPAEPAKKNDEVNLQAVLDAINGVKAQVEEQGKTVTGLVAKVDDVVKQQTATATSLDAVTKKAEAVEGILKGTVTAPPQREDQPSGHLRAVKREDEDPRTGTFDTAYLPRRNRVGMQR